MDWKPPQKPAELAETRLLEGILSGRFPVNSNLPGERRAGRADRRHPPHLARGHAATGA